MTTENYTVHPYIEKVLHKNGFSFDKVSNGRARYLNKNKMAIEVRGTNTQHVFNGNGNPIELNMNDYEYKAYDLSKKLKEHVAQHNNEMIQNDTNIHGNLIKDLNDYYKSGSINNHLISENKEETLHGKDANLYAKRIVGNLIKSKNISAEHLIQLGKANAGSHISSVINHKNIQASDLPKLYKSNNDTITDAILDSDKADGKLLHNIYTDHKSNEHIKLLLLKHKNLAKNDLNDIATAPDSPVINIDGKWKHKQNSLGKPIHSTVEGIKNFHHWFGGSKIVDKYGRPLVAYHGSHIDGIDEFKPTDSERTGFMGSTTKVKSHAFFFSGDKDLAWDFAHNRHDYFRYDNKTKQNMKANVMSVYLKSDNPLDLSGTPAQSIRKLKSIGIDTDKEIGSHSPTIPDIYGLLDHKHITDKFLEKGHDAVFLKEDSIKGGRSIAILKQNNIKSIKNHGTFSHDSNKLLESLISCLS